MWAIVSILCPPKVNENYPKSALFNFTTNGLCMWTVDRTLVPHLFVFLLSAIESSISAYKCRFVVGLPCMHKCYIRDKLFSF